MFELSQYFLFAGTILVAVALLAKIVAFSRERTPALDETHAGHAASRRGGVALADRPEVATPENGHGAGSGEARGLMWYSSRMVWVAFAFLTISLVLRAVVTGHGPFTNQHEYAVSFSWGILLCYLWFERQYKARTLALLVLPVATGLLLYSLAMDTEVRPLVPALQNNWLLSLHVATAVIAYGAACISFAAAVLFLIRPHIKWRGLPSREVLDEMGYRGAVLCYPMLTAMLILGAIWADIAWGRYWSWDPKETASLVTWLIYSGYLHARVVRDWRGNKAAYLLIIGFAAVLFTYFGNHFLGGMHSYA
ncbi:MAG: c-type cytochrome biogenesis protein CcsB [Mobilicoccus sp.]|nr:c-type cytochrome biogenesis protein CcsB [Mobilicoccus sp.]